MSTAPMSTGGGWANATIPRGRARPSPGQDSEGGLTCAARSLGEGRPSGDGSPVLPGKLQAGGFQEPPPPTPPR
jgi:hypothetical protein